MEGIILKYQTNTVKNLTSFYFEQKIQKISI